MSFRDEVTGPKIQILIDMTRRVGINTSHKSDDQARLPSLVADDRKEYRLRCQYHSSSRVGDSLKQYSVVDLSGNHAQETPKCLEIMNDKASGWHTGKRSISLCSF